MTVSDAVLYLFMALACGAAMVAHWLLAAARAFVAERHPDWHAALGAKPALLRMGGVEERARRRLLRPLLLGRMPPAPAADPELARLATALRLAFATLAAAGGGMALALALRSAGGA